MMATCNVQHLPQPGFKLPKNCEHSVVHDEETALALLRGLLDSEDHTVTFVNNHVGHMGLRLVQLLQHQTGIEPQRNSYGHHFFRGQNLVLFPSRPPYAYNPEHLTDYVDYIPGFLLREKLQCRTCQTRYPCNRDLNQWSRCPRCLGFQLAITYDDEPVWAEPRGME